MLLVRLQKTLRIFCFQKTLWLDNLLPGAPVRVVALKYFWKIMYDWILGQVLPLYTASSLSFSSDLVRGVHARASVRSEKRGRQPASPVSRLQSRAWSFACLERFVRRTREKRETARSLLLLEPVWKTLEGFGFCFAFVDYTSCWRFLNRWHFTPNANGICTILHPGEGTPWILSWMYPPKLSQNVISNFAVTPVKCS